MKLIKFVYIAVITGGALLILNAGTSAQMTIELAAYTFPPYSLKTENGYYTGADIEITEAVFKRLGYRIKWIDLPFNRALDGVKKGVYPGIAPCVASETRKAFTHFSSIPTAALDRVFFKRKDSDLSWRSYEDLRGLTVGACDYSYPEHFWKAGEKGMFAIEVVKNTHPDLSNFKKLVKKRIDILIVDRAVGMNIIRENAPQFDMVDVVPEISVDHAPVPFSLGLSKKYWALRGTAGDDLMRAYEKELAAFVKSGKRNAIFAQYSMSYTLDADNHIILK